MASVQKMGFTTPTPVQRDVIPIMMTGADVLAQSPTGTGKTCAFGIPAVNAVDMNDTSIQAVVLCPTRELAMQSEKELTKLSEGIAGLRVLAIYGGQSFPKQLSALKRKPRIVVCTPGRLLDHLERRTISLKNVRTVVLDEADEMLKMGFRDDIDLILSKIGRVTQTVMFSATMPNEILDISRNYQKNPQMISAVLPSGQLPEIKQRMVQLKEGRKLDALKSLMQGNDLTFVLCFCNTKRRVDVLTSQLESAGMLARGLHGDLRQRQRDEIMDSFRRRKINILVATDVAARGIDVDNVEAVINYDMPLENDYYVHRIGRTARANRTGESYSFVTPTDFHRLRDIQRFLGIKLEEHVIPGISVEDISTKPQQVFKLPSVRYFINAGSRDGLTAESLKKLICGDQTEKESTILDISMKPEFSFVEIEKHAADTLLALNGTMYNNRSLKVEKSLPPQGRQPQSRQPRRFDNGPPRRRTDSPRRRSGSSRSPAQ